MGQKGIFRPLSSEQQNQIVVIYPPLDLNVAIHQCDLLKTCFADSSIEPTLLFIGRLDIQKMPILFIRIAARITHAKARIIGDGPLSLDLRNHVFSDFTELSRRLTWTGALSHDSIQLELLKSSQSILLLTSIFEGVPIVVLEALGTGTPVITTQCGGIYEIIEDSSWNTDFSEFHYITSANQSIIIYRYDHASLILMDCQSMRLSDELVLLFTAETEFWLAKLDRESHSFGKEKYPLHRWQNAADFRQKYSPASFTQRWQMIFNNL